MVGLAWRAQAGLSSYPDWQQGPYVTNFLGPLYFLLTGLLGRATSASIDELFLLGRGVSLASTIVSSILIGLFLGRQYGLRAGLLGTVFSLGCGPQTVFTTLTRPDAMSVALGITGFLLASVRANAVAALFLIAAILTKQTTAAYLLAAGVLISLQQCPRLGLFFIGGCGITLLAIVTAVTAVWEPNFFTCLLGEAAAPWSWNQWQTITFRLLLQSPGTVVLPMLGLATAMRPERDTGLAVLSTILLTTCLTSVAKTGSDVNYFLPLAGVEAWSIVRIYRLSSAETPVGGKWKFILTSLVLIVSLPGAWNAIQHSLKVQIFHSTLGQHLLESYPRFFTLAENPSVKLLTDSGVVAIRQQDRAPFWDPFLFRMLVDTDRIKPDWLSQRIANKDFDIIMLTANVEDSNYGESPFSLPIPLAQQVRHNYRLVKREAGLFIYLPR